MKSRGEVLPKYVTKSDIGGERCMQIVISPSCSIMLNRSCVVEEYLYLFSTQIHIR